MVITHKIISTSRFVEREKGYVKKTTLIVLI